MNSSPTRNPTSAEVTPPLSLTSTDAEGSSKKVRKPYTITKSRESWTEEEHDKFLEALQLNPTSAEVTPPLSSTSTDAEGSSKKVRKPYTITKSRESWTEEEHDKFLEALQLFDRDWKKIEDFVGSKTVIQIRSHAQKYFLKVQKNGTLAHVPRINYLFVLRDGVYHLIRITTMGRALVIIRIFFESPRLAFAFSFLLFLLQFLPLM
ncbi:hypothetical protein F2Q69_00032107 [Brassica cretica]|uniref:Uncharacterized protein n=1 Tax=Brassica cretica TaxID=69181 RepID=A0A8S9RT30_BRACR|nr:hypothetical protein F2Q69_00032107 [Brassica cretica]